MEATADALVSVRKICSGVSATDVEPRTCLLSPRDANRPFPRGATLPPRYCRGRGFKMELRRITLNIFCYCRAALLAVADRMLTLDQLALGKAILIAVVA